MSLARAALLAGLVGLVAMTAVALSRDAQRPAGTNNIPSATFVATVPGGKTLCQRDEFVPGDTAALGIVAGTHGKRVGPLELTLRTEGRTVTSGRLGRGLPDGDVQVPVDPVPETVASADLCIENRGRHPVALGGAGLPPSVAAHVGGAPEGGRIRVVYWREGTESREEMLATVAHRFEQGKAEIVGGWTFPLVLLLLFGGVAAAAVALGRAEAA